MTRLTGRNATTVIVAGGVAAVTAAVMAGSPALAGKSPARAAATPLIISGSKELVILTGAATVAKLPLPAGGWAIFAKADASTQGGGPVQLHCQLKAGTSTDHTDPELEAGGSAAFDENIALNVAHKFSAPGSATLACNSSGVTVDMVSIKITAIKAGTLQIVKLS
jgi:hypothetical protein